MRRKLIAIIVLVVSTAAMPFSGSAQGLGGLLKKGKEKIEKVANQAKEKIVAPANAVQEETTKAVTTFDNGIQMENPMAEYIDVTPVGLYGVSTSENYGNAYLVLKVLMKEPVNKASFGGSVNNEKMIAVDAGGKVYNTDANGTFSFDTPEGIPVSVVINQPPLTFTGIKKTNEVMPVVKFGIWIDAKKNGNITLKNVPIYWDKELE